MALSCLRVMNVKYVAISMTQPLVMRVRGLNQEHRLKIFRMTGSAQFAEPQRKSSPRSIKAHKYN